MSSLPAGYKKDIPRVSRLSKAAGHSKILVLCIDRDDDIGSKGGIETPIVGRDSCINAGTRLAIEDPEDADANAIFGAIKTYEELVSKGYNTEVAIVAGKENRGVEADEKISLEIQSILDKYPADAAVLVSDGEDDERVLPVIQSWLPVISVQRIIMRHSRSVEYSYAVLGRYIRMLAFDSQYSKFFLGVPGILLFAGGLAVAFGVTKWLMALILGILAGVLIILASLANGISSIPQGTIRPDASAIDIATNRIVVGSFMHGTVTLLWIGIATILGGFLLSNWFKGRSIRMISNILSLAVLALMYIPVQQFTSVLNEGTNPFTLISSLLVGLAVSLVAATFVFQYFRNKKGESKPLAD